MNSIRPRLPSPALIVACLALFAALGGTTYAATATSASSRITWSNAKLVNGWSSKSPEAPAGYTKDSVGIVHLRGLAIRKSGGPGCNSTSVAFVLPSGLRPGHTLVIYSLGGANGGDGPFGAVIHSNGQVTGCDALYLDGISFVAGQ